MDPIFPVGTKTNRRTHWPAPIRRCRRAIVIRQRRVAGRRSCLRLVAAGQGSPSASRSSGFVRCATSGRHQRADRGGGRRRGSRGRRGCGDHCGSRLVRGELPGRSGCRAIRDGMAGRSSLAFCIDESLGRTVAEALRLLRAPGSPAIKDLREWGYSGAHDEVWLAHLPREGVHVVVTRDSRILQASVRRDIWRAAGLALFVLEARWSDIKLLAQARALVWWWPRIVAQAEAGPPGGAWEVKLPPPMGASSAGCFPTRGRKGRISQSGYMHPHDAALLAHGGGWHPRSAHATPPPAASPPPPPASTPPCRGTLRPPAAGPGRRWSAR